jgi:GntR family transcriptional regulator, rspAB operon transcriptional repressor
MRALDLRKAKTTYIDAAYQAILEALLNHEFKPGDRLAPSEIAAKLGLSRSPVDRAIERLAGELLVEMRPGKGPFVAKLTITEVLECYELRLLLEEQAIRVGFALINDDYLDQFKELVDDHARLSRDRNGSYASQYRLSEADKEIHLAIISLWKNHRAKAWHQQVNVHIKSALVTNIAGYFTEQSVREHNSILEALESGDPNKSIEMVRLHEANSRSAFLARAQHLDTTS